MDILKAMKELNINITTGRDRNFEELLVKHLKKDYVKLQPDILKIVPELPKLIEEQIRDFVQSYLRLILRI